MSLFFLVVGCVPPAATVPGEIVSGQNICGQVPDINPPFDPDPSKISPEALLSAYLKVDTTNPAGCEGRAARFWKKFFDNYGVPSEIITLPFGEDRANIIARVNAGQKNRPIILLNHMDVVPADPARWSVNPFAGEIRDGFIYGRGAFDMKATAVYQALILVKASVQKWNLNRDLIFLGTANEEGPFDPARGIISGAEWMLKKRLKDIGRAEYVVTEGGYIPSPGGQQSRWEVSPGEKARMEITFKSRDKGDARASNIKMALNAHKIMSEFTRPLELDDPQNREAILSDPNVRANFETTHALTMLGGIGKGNTLPAEAVAVLIFPGGAARRTLLESAVSKSLPKGVGMAEIRQVGQDLKIILRALSDAVHASVPPLNGGANTLLVNAIYNIDLKIAEKGFPAKTMMVDSLASVAAGQTESIAEFVVDFRLLPGESRDRLLADVRRIISDKDFEIVITDDAVIAPQSSVDTDLFRAIVAANERFQAGIRKKASVESPILTSTTDAAYFRKKGMIVYGFEPIPLDPDDEHSHGDDERIPVASLRYALDVTEYYLRLFLTGSASDIQNNNFKK